MQALVFDGEVRFESARARPERSVGNARLEVLCAGICDTDLQIARGYMGFAGVLGHEFVGRVVEADDPRWLGKRCVADINAACGTCGACRSGNAHHCPARTVLGIVGRDGALAEEVVVPQGNLVEVPETVSDDRAVFAEPLAAALHVTDDLPEEVRSGRERAVVVGDGKLGLLIALSLRAAGVPTQVVGHHESKLRYAAQVGCDVALEADVQGVAATALAVVEATGSERGLERALTLLRPRGTLVLKTTVAGPTRVDLSRVVIDELRVVGSRCGDMTRAVRALESRSVDPTPLITTRFPLPRALEAFDVARRKGTLKVLVDRAASR